ncbi:RHS repeat-associated protein [Chryseobacterium ginsenosidimutans]|uniref:polymorphic toxin-type HINT domain-containing protein n=1 Tax=Chryseobacterium ginsenosidimutans TaxID=687846 RepID=UPI00277DB5D4|nr:polymorphic toxin-type HINT domain-containing protein [Chryseobacterium ginsenosidimutans]MDQ0593930.1 RHS repeat-associated protein [Chryseobacterium ginsenosidimutans]
MKKNKFLYLLILAVTGILRGQVQPTAAENYLYTKTCLNGDCTKKSETVTYYDGLARPKQNILLNTTPQGKDIVSKIEYDSYGRPSKSYLPLPQQMSQNGAIYPSPDASFYGSEKIFSENKFEEFPKARLTESYPQGTAWADKPNRYTYAVNAANEVKMYVAQTTYSNNIPSTSITQSASYPAATLDKVTVTDADLNPSTEYKNGKGQTVMVRKNDGTNNTDTYYAYDNYGRLSYIIPPLASAVALTTTNVDKLCYQYQYDTRGRQIAKKLPGKGWEYMVYDKADRLILSQDGTMNSKGQWLITKYDPFGRVAYTGILTGGNRATRQNNLNNTVVTENRSTTGFTRNGMTVYYTDNAFAGEIPTILTVNYYDTYPAGSPASPTQILGQNVLPQDPQNSAVSTRSLPVASYIKNIEDDSWTKMYNWYDTNGRNIAAYSINHLGGYTKTETEIDFTGITKRAVTKHKRINTDTERTVIETFEYDSQNRLLVHKHQVDNNPVEILAQNSYNAISQLTNKKVGGVTASNPLQSIDFAYNIRGWMTKINDPKNLNGKLFGYEIKYNQVEGLQTPNTDYTNLQVKPRYNGNIAEVDWKTNTSTGDNLRRYGYVYDGLNRLSAGFYQKDNNPSAKEYFEKIDYDLNGNITNLKRSAEAQQGAPAFLIDNLTYVSDGNRLTSVTDSSTDYRGYPDVSGIAITYYDESGNMKSQKDKGILDIKYNYLNLPNAVTFDKTYVPRVNLGEGGDFNVNTQYLYRADGVKLRKTYTYGSGQTNIETSTRTEYLDGFQYEATSSTGKFTLGLKFVPTAEGYYNFENNKYIYSYTDHLGNVRLSYFNNGTSAEVLEENNYYPFGLKHDGYNALKGNLSYQYKYNGKELQKESGMLDYGWRQYMPELGRWNGMDQLAEMYNDISPFAYVGNNPIMMFDPDGRKMSGTYGNDPRKDVQWDPNKPGGDNNPDLIEEVVVGQEYDMTPPAPSIGLLSYLLGSVTSSGDAFNNMLTSTFFGLSSNQAMNNYQRNLSNYQLAVQNSKGAREVEEFEKFLFLELPASFAGGELVSVGWRATGLSRYICGPLGRLSNGLFKICFTEGTLVATENGNKKIEDIKEGDLVWSYNEETGKKELKKVVELSRNTSSSLVKISVNGTEITCTPEHPFFVNGNWVEAKNLTKGTLLTTLDGTTSPVESIKFLDEKVKVYNFEVEDNHNYYVSEKGILVHNDCGVGTIVEAMPSSLKQMFQCKQFAAGLMKRMTAQGLKGEMLTLRSETDFIWSNTFNQTITKNSEHVAVKVGNMVYDNMFPKGIEYSKWLMDLEVGRYPVPMPTITPF